MNVTVKFSLLIGAVVGSLAWLAAGGISETKTYYKTVAELQQMGNGAHGKRLRVGGDVVEKSIVRTGTGVRFVIKDISHGNRQLPVVYTGIDPLPDTFRDGAQALADGRLAANGTFEATKIQAKCASKYEAKPTKEQLLQTKRAGV